MNKYNVYISKRLDNLHVDGNNLKLFIDGSDSQIFDNREIGSLFLFDINQKNRDKILDSLDRKKINYFLFDKAHIKKISYHEDFNIKTHHFLFDQNTLRRLNSLKSEIGYNQFININYNNDYVVSKREKEIRKEFFYLKISEKLQIEHVRSFNKIINKSISDLSYDFIDSKIKRRGDLEAVFSLYEMILKFTITYLECLLIDMLKISPEIKSEIYENDHSLIEDLISFFLPLLITHSNYIIVKDLVNLRDLRSSQRGFFDFSRADDNEKYLSSDSIKIIIKLFMINYIYNKKSIFYTFLKKLCDILNVKEISDVCNSL